MSKELDEIRRKVKQLARPRPQPVVHLQHRDANEIGGRRRWEAWDTDHPWKSRWIAPKK